jgi:hypothetical protein
MAATMGRMKVKISRDKGTHEALVYLSRVLRGRLYRRLGRLESVWRGGHVAPRERMVGVVR